jgi:hypothetical protein
MGSKQQLKPSSIEAKHVELMAGYRAALRESEDLNAFNRELVQHVVAVSSARAALQLYTHVEFIALAETTEAYAQKVAEGDLVAGGLGHGSSWLGRALQASLGGQTLLVAISLPAAAIALWVLNLGRFVSTATAVGLIYFTLQLLGNMAMVAQPAKRVLAEKLDAAEWGLFSLTGAPPQRIFINLVGPLLVLPVLVLLGLLVVRAVAAFSEM